MTDTKYADFLAEVTKLVDHVKADISPEYRASTDADDDTPGIQLTVAVNTDSQIVDCDYRYQTGDNSYTGPVYSQQHWAVVSVYDDAESDQLALDILNQLLDLIGY